MRRVHRVSAVYRFSPDVPGPKSQEAGFGPGDCRACSAYPATQTPDSTLTPISPVPNQAKSFLIWREPGGGKITRRLRLSLTFYPADYIPGTKQKPPECRVASPLRLSTNAREQARVWRVRGPWVRTAESLGAFPLHLVVPTRNDEACSGGLLIRGSDPPYPGTMEMPGACAPDGTIKLSRLFPVRPRISASFYPTE